MKYITTTLVSLALAWGMFELGANYNQVMHLFGLNLSLGDVQTAQFSLCLASFCAFICAFCVAFLGFCRWSDKTPQPVMPALPLCGKCLSISIAALILAIVSATTIMPTLKLGNNLYVITPDWKIFVFLPGIPVFFTTVFLSIAIIFAVSRHEKLNTEV